MNRDNRANRDSGKNSDILKGDQGREAKTRKASRLSPRLLSITKAACRLGQIRSRSGGAITPHTPARDHLGAALEWKREVDVCGWQMNES